jgi:hypothetical protein
MDLEINSVTAWQESCAAESMRVAAPKVLDRRGRAGWLPPLAGGAEHFDFMPERHASSVAARP